MSIDRAVHIHPRPRGDLVLCEGCRKGLPLVCDANAQRADELATLAGWLVTQSMARSFHWCPTCRKGVEL